MLLLTRLVLFVAALIPLAQAHAQALDTGFAPEISNGAVRALAVGADGRVVAAGGFTTVAGVTRNRMVRFRVDGSVDPIFDPNVANGAVRAMIVDAVGDYVIAGGFTIVGGVTRNRLARIDLLGNVDPGFSPSANDLVHALVEVPDTGQIYAAGAFTTMNGVTRARIARLNDTGALDTGFVPPSFTGTAHAVAIQADGKVLVGGDLGLSGQFGARRLYRLNANGSLDTGFLAEVGIDGIAVPFVYGIAVEADGGILIAGEFTRVNGQVRQRVARLRPDGSLDTGYVPPNLNATVHRLVLQPDGRALIGGDFTGLSLRDGLARLNHNGSLDGQFAGLLLANNSVFALLAHPDGSVYFGGSFTEITGIGRSRMARLNLACSLDIGFSATINPNGNVLAVATQPDGRILIGGDFVTVHGQPRQRLARLLANGALDTAFVADLNGVVLSIAVLPDGKILVGGGFSTINGQSRPRLVRLNPDGSRDNAFNAQLSSGLVRTILPLRDGRILIGGGFTEVAGQPRQRLARLLPNGALDPDFLSFALDGDVRALVLLPDDRVVIGGDFQQMGGFAIPRLIRLQTNGAVDPSLLVDLNGPVYSVAPMDSGDFILGGSFTYVGSVIRERMARVSSSGGLRDYILAALARVEAFIPMSDGQVFMAGRFDRLQGGLAGGGSPIWPKLVLVRASPPLRDTSYNAGFAEEEGGIYSMALQPDGQLITVGEFTSVGGETRVNIARLRGRAHAMQSLRWDPGSGQVSWRPTGEQRLLRQGRRPELLVATECCDPAAFQPAAVDPRMQPVLGEFRLADFVPPEGLFYLRVRTLNSDGAAAGTSLYLSPAVQLFNPENSDIIFRNGFQ